eukprot:TRINITY_DN441_c0_g1_i1.p1 TRINITY_DN441_c0_g1~~TRINITY_DN441_c0_g1_i1.p1  ORF type:complete len:165 (-),score=27.50 TRINITY_DN441_c0_g1_i1:232-726(-)
MCIRDSINAEYMGNQNQQGQRYLLNQFNRRDRKKMCRMDVLADALKTILNAEKNSRKQVMIKPVSKVVIKFLKLMQKYGYIGEFEIIDDHRSKKIVIELMGRLNKCGVISPRYDIQFTDFEKWTNNILPSRQFGHLVLTTTYGILTHDEARQRHTGGKIVGFFY